MSRSRIEATVTSDYIQYQLQSLWMSQLAANEKLPLIPKELDDRKDIFDWVKKHPDFRKAYTMAVNYMLKPPDHEELKEIKDHFSGNIHQLIAYNIIAELESQNGSIVLGPENTLNFFEALYFKDSERDSVEMLFGERTIRNMSVPDGLVLQSCGNKIEIVKVLEYSLYGGSDKFRNRIEAFMWDGYRYPDIFNNAYLVYVIAENSKTYFGNFNRKVSLMEIPITHNQYRNFVTGIFKIFNGFPTLHAEEIKADSENPTLIELRNWAIARRPIREKVREGMGI